MRKHIRWAWIGVLTAVAIPSAGCRVEHSGQGDDKDVKIATPFGGMQVKTNEAVVPGEIGLPIYPGASEVRKSNDTGGAADVNMNFGSFQMRIKAVSYQTPDAPDKVEAFYRDALGHFGDVIACRNNHAVGAPAQTSEGLSCDNSKGNHITVEETGDSTKLQLKAGSKQHRHIVAIEPRGSGTKFGLVALDLPGRFFSDEHESGGDRQ